MSDDSDTDWDPDRERALRGLDKASRLARERQEGPRKSIAERKAAADAGKSYTAKLLAGGVEKVGAKVTEEAAEVVEAAAEPGDAGRTHTIAEAGDVLYHLLVLLALRDIKLADVEAELARRFGMSGLEEKASRSSQT